jgi:predicted ATP-binding protein involved in virulence
MIKALKVTGLFGRFTYSIECKPDGITIITGPNGFGKSTILKIIDSLSRVDIAFFLQLEFKEIVVTYDTHQTTMCNPATHRLDLSRLETQINQLNPHDSNVVQGQMQEAKNESDTISDPNSLLMVTQGHDFLNYFHQLCSYSLRQHVVLPKAKELCRSLLCSYRLSDFKSTNLYRNLTSIQQASNRTIVLE